MNKPSKRDLRSKFTVSIFESAVLKKMAEGSMKKISVSSLCKEANVTRATFYNHYESVSDVFTNMERKFYDDFHALIHEKSFDQLDEKTFLSFAHLILEKRDLASYISKHLDGDVLIKKILRLTQSEVKRNIAKLYPNLSHDIIGTFFSFISHGIMGIVFSWVDGGFSATADRIGESIYHYMKASVIALDAEARQAEEKS